MRFRLIPREEKFFDMFVEQAETIVESAELLLDLMTDFTNVDQKVMRMNKLEHKGDEIMHRIVAKLNVSFITPLDQEDIHSLASALDDVVDLIDATVERMMVYKVGQPTEDAVYLSNIIFRCAEETMAAVKELHSFKKNLTKMKQCWIEINRLENEADTASRSAIVKLFEHESDAVEVIKWKEIYELLERATDSCEDVANILEQIVLKHS